jgi:hypothetical protein
MNIATQELTNRIAQPGNRPDAAATPEFTSQISTIEDTKKMLLYEDMSRVRMREDQRLAARHRQADRVLTVRRWERLAGWAAKRAAKLRDQ